MAIVRRRVELLDTCILLNLLEVPFESDEHADVSVEFLRKQQQGTQLRLAAATLIETGDHVGRIVDGTQRRVCSGKLENLIRATYDGSAPWSFSELSWNRGFLQELLTPCLGASKLGSLQQSLATKYLEMGDLCVLAEFRRLRAQLNLRVVDVDVWTLDSALRGVVDAIRN